VLDKVAACVDETVRLGVPDAVGICELLTVRDSVSVWEREAVWPWLGVTLGVTLDVDVADSTSEDDCEGVTAADALWVCDAVGVPEFV